MGTAPTTRHTITVRADGHATAACLLAEPDGTLPRAEPRPLCAVPAYVDHETGQELGPFTCEFVTVMNADDPLDFAQSVIVAPQRQDLLGAMADAVPLHPEASLPESLPAGVYEISGFYLDGDVDDDGRSVQTWCADATVTFVPSDVFE